MAGHSAIAGLRDAIETLMSQRTVLTANGLDPGSGQSERQLSEVAGRLGGEGVTSDAAVDALVLSLAEIVRRQSLIQTRFGAESFESIALEALASAMHRIRTCLDVAMANVEEIAEVCEGTSEAEFVAEGAAEAVRSLRLVYHYTHELNDMAGAQQRFDRIAPEPFDCLEVIDALMRRFERLASDSGVEISHVSDSRSMPCSTDAGVVNRILRQLVLLSVVSPGVSRVEIATKRIGQGAASLTVIRITDNGDGLSLTDRAATSQLASTPDNEKFAADLAGFAVARRMAKAIGGKLSLEHLRGRGSRVQLSFPSSLPGRCVETSEQAAASA